MADEALKKVVARNVTDGPKTLNATPAVTLQAGQSTDGEVEISAAELENAKLVEWFEFGAKPAPEIKAELKSEAKTVAK